MVLACRLAPYLQGSSLGPTPTQLCLPLGLSFSLCHWRSLSSFSRATLDLMGGCVCREHYSLSRRLLANPSESSRSRGSVTTLGNKSSFSRGNLSRLGSRHIRCYINNGWSGPLCINRSLSTTPHKSSTKRCARFVC